MKESRTGPDTSPLEGKAREFALETRREGLKRATETGGVYMGHGMVFYKVKELVVWQHEGWVPEIFVFNTVEECQAYYMGHIYSLRKGSPPYPVIFWNHPAALKETDFSEMPPITDEATRHLHTFGADEYPIEEDLCQS